MLLVAGAVMLIAASPATSQPHPDEDVRKSSVVWRSGCGVVIGRHRRVMQNMNMRRGVSRRGLLGALGSAMLGYGGRAWAQGKAFEVKWVGASRDVTRGDLTPKISLESLRQLRNLYAIGPPEALRGEITIVDSHPSVSTVENGRIITDHSFRHRALFLVWAEVPGWHEIPVPRTVSTYRDVETFVAGVARGTGLDITRPLPFRLRGSVARLNFHIFNKRDDAPHSPDAHERIKARFAMEDVVAEMLGFWSDKHEGIFIPSGRSAHIHFRTADSTVTGHVDDLELRSGSVLALPQS